MATFDEVTATIDEAVQQAADAMAGYGYVHFAWAALGIVLTLGGTDPAWYPGRYAGGEVFVALLVGAGALALSRGIGARLPVAWWLATVAVLGLTVVSMVNLPRNMTLFACAFAVLRWKVALDLANATTWRVFALGKLPHPGALAVPAGAPPGWRPPGRPADLPAGPAPLPAYLGATPMFASAYGGSSVPAHPSPPHLPPDPAAVVPAPPAAAPVPPRDPFATGTAYGEPPPDGNAPVGPEAAITVPGPLPDDAAPLDPPGFPDPASTPPAPQPASPPPASPPPAPHAASPPPAFAPPHPVAPLPPATPVAPRPPRPAPPPYDYFAVARPHPG